MDFDFRSLLAESWERVRCWSFRGVFYSVWALEGRVLVVAYDVQDGAFLVSREFPVMGLTYGDSKRRAIELDDFIKRAQATRSGKRGPARCADPEFAKRWPAIHSFLTDMDGEKGQIRLTSSLTLFTDSGQFKCFFNDKELGASFCLSADTALGALDAVEAALVSGKAPWRLAEETNGRKSGKHR